jgi:hypothetical protein
MTIVIAGHSRSQNGFASLAYARQFMLKSGTKQPRADSEPCCC